MNKKYKVLISAPYMRPVIDKLMPVFRKNNIEVIVPFVKERLSEKELLKVILDIDGVICGDDQFTEKVIRKAKKLKVISKWGTGIDSIDKKACNKYGVEICNTPNAFTIPVSESVIAYILCFARKIPWMNKQLHLGCWNKIQGKALSEYTLGIIGLGNIGQRVAKLAKAFNMKILGNDIKKIPSKILNEYGIKLVKKDELIEKSDFISINCDLNPTSYHMIGSKEFNKMRENVVIINTARGSIINENAMIRALKKNKISGAALDVYEKEPVEFNNPLIKMENVLMAPHNSNSSPKAWEHVHKVTICNLINGLKKEK